MPADRQWGCMRMDPIMRKNRGGRIVLTRMKEKTSLKWSKMKLMSRKMPKLMAFPIDEQVGKPDSIREKRGELPITALSSFVLRDGKNRSYHRIQASIMQNMKFWALGAIVSVNLPCRISLPFLFQITTDV